MEDTDDLFCTSLSVVAVAIASVAVEIVRRNHTGLKRLRRMWVKDILRKRNQEGTFNLLIPQLLSDDCQNRNIWVR